jgi:hypothetical protein
VAIISFAAGVAVYGIVKGENKRKTEESEMCHLTPAWVVQALHPFVEVKEINVFFHLNMANNMTGCSKEARV